MRASHVLKLRSLTCVEKGPVLALVAAGAPGLTNKFEPDDAKAGPHLVAPPTCWS